MASLTGTFTLPQQVSAVLTLGPGQSANVVLTKTGESFTVQVEQVVGSAYKVLGTHTADTAGTTYPNNSVETIYLRLIMTAAKGMSLAYTLEDVAGESVGGIFPIRNATGTVVFDVSDDGIETPKLTATDATITTAAVTTLATGAVTGSGGALFSSATLGIGYATGAGGAVTQATSKATAVTSSKVTSAITLNGASLAAATVVAFTLTNTVIAATDTVICTHESAGTSGAYTINAFPAAGSAVISVRNNTAGALAEAIVVRVTVIKSVSA